MAGNRLPLESRLFRNARVNAATGCIEWQGDKHISGYGVIRNRYVRFRTHRVAYELAHGPIPAGMCVCHRCDNRVCINAAHLFLGSIQDNVKDKVNKGRQSRGHKHSEAMRAAHRRKPAWRV